MCVTIKDEHVTVCKAQRPLRHPTLNVMRALPRRAGHGQGRREVRDALHSLSLTWTGQQGEGSGETGRGREHWGFNPVVPLHSPLWLPELTSSCKVAQLHFYVPP